MADTAHSNLVEIIRQAENEYHHDLTDRTLEDYIAEAILNSGYVSAERNGQLPEFEFDGKRLLYNGVDITSGAKDFYVECKPNSFPNLTVVFDCLSIKTNQLGTNMAIRSSAHVNLSKTESDIHDP